MRSTINFTYYEKRADNIIGLASELCRTEQDDLPHLIWTLKALKYISINHEDQRVFFQFKTIIDILVGFFRFIWIPMLWVYSYYKYVYSYSAGIDFRRQNLTSTDVRFWRLKSIPALQGLNPQNSYLPLPCLHQDAVFDVLVDYLDNHSGPHAGRIS